MFPRRLLIAVGVALVTLFAFVPTQPATAGTEFNGLINGLRASKGLGALQSDARLDAVAQDWANQMAARGAISHRSSLSGAIGGGWAKLGENVGTGGSAGTIFGALVASPGHYRNMVDSTFTHVGTGVARGANGRLYTAHNFGAKVGASAPNAAAGPRAAAAKPAPAPRSTVRPRAQAPAAAVSAPAAAQAAPLAPAPLAASPVAVAGVASTPNAPAQAATTPTSPATPANLEFGLAEVSQIAVQG